MKRITMVLTGVMAVTLVAAMWGRPEPPNSR